jgi:hypothetical protein
MLYYVQVKIDGTWRDEAGFVEFEDAHRHAKFDRTVHRFPIRIIEEIEYL